MARVLGGLLAVLGLLVTTSASSGGETTKLRHLVSIYSDEKGGAIQLPEGVACNDKGVVVVGDTGNGRLLRYTVQEKDVKPAGEIKAAQFSSPIRVQMNSRAEIFTLDGKQRRILRFGPNGEFKDVVSLEGVPVPSTIVPRSFKIDRGDNLYVLDIFSERVVVASPDGKYQRHLDFPKGVGFLSDLAVDSRGAIYVVDSVNAMIHWVPKDGTSFSPLTKSLREYLSFPTYLAIDSRGILYVVDEDGGGIVLLGQDGSYLGRQLSPGWNEGLLYFPSQVCITEHGEMFVADRGNSRVQLFSIVK
jgi:sugar lactone lactonase YvrE